MRSSCLEARHSLALLVLLLGTSCSVITQPEREQCKTIEDCRRKGGPESDLVCVDSVCQDNPVWSCLLHPVTQVPSGEATARVRITIRGLVEEEPVAGVAARLCNRLDIDCMRPLTIVAPPDENGSMSFEVPIGFDGYLEMLAPDRVPGLYVFDPPVVADREIAWLPLVRAAQLAQFASLGGRPIVSGRGHIMLGAYDCLRQAAPGVLLSSTDADQRTSPFYVVGKLPSLTAPATDASGRGGLINVRAGSASVSGALQDGRPIGTISMVVRADSISYTSLVPGIRTAAAQ